MTVEPTVLFSSAAAYARAARSQLLRAFPDARASIIEPELGSLTGVDMTVLASACTTGAVTFVRHLAAPVAQVMRPCSADDIAGAAAEAVAPAGLARVGVQAWRTGGDGLNAEDVRAAVARRLEEQDVEVARSGAGVVLAVCLATDAAHVCLTPAELALSDWPGGRIRLARRPEQVSRAEFKLEELFTTFALPAGAGRRALDLGASPGGWTRILRGRGYEVWAVDPGEMHPDVAGDPGVHVHPTTAGRFLDEHETTFDLVVNDMRMVPATSCDLMVAAAGRLRDGGLAVVTLKLAPRHADRVVRDALRRLERRYHVVFARQLFHNRNEVTVVGRLR